MITAENISSDGFVRTAQRCKAQISRIVNPQTPRPRTSMALS